MMQPQAIFDFITSRRSIGNLAAPAPSHEQVRQAVSVALTAPDHKALRPYRFVVLEGEALVKFGDALYQAAANSGETDEKALQKAKFMPNRAAMIIACVTHYQDHPKVPHSEQLLAAAAAVQNLLLALHAMGFASVWRTGPLAYTDTINQFFGLSEDNSVVGFVYVGSSDIQMPPRPPLVVDDYVRFF